MTERRGHMPRGYHRRPAGGRAKTRPGGHAHPYVSARRARAEARLRTGIALSVPASPRRTTVHVNPRARAGPGLELGPRGPIQRPSPSGGGPSVQRRGRSCIRSRTTAGGFDPWTRDVKPLPEPPVRGGVGTILPMLSVYAPHDPPSHNPGPYALRTQAQAPQDRDPQAQEAPPEEPPQEEEPLGRLPRRSTWRPVRTGSGRPPERGRPVSASENPAAARYLPAPPGIHPSP